MAKKPAETDKEKDGEDEGGQAAAPAAKRGRLRFVVIGLAAVLLLGGGAGAYYVFSARAPQKAAEVPAKPPAFFDLPDVLVNLSGTGTDRPQYLKLKIVLELPDPAVAEQIRPALPRVMDTFQVFLRELRPTDLEGSAGVFRLREELTRRVNMAIAPNKVTAVLFKEIVVQ
ncbi:MAG: flagellar basal body-associated protein FliL [Variibacter sp.]|nr:flagellar basal body-associated protein FliL [Variibacter sp.]